MSVSPKADDSTYTLSSQAVIISTSLVGGCLLLGLLVLALYRKSRAKANSGCDLPIFRHARKSTGHSGSTFDHTTLQSVESRTTSTQYNVSRPLPSTNEMPPTAVSTDNRPNYSTRHDILRSEQKYLAPPHQEFPTSTLAAPSINGADEDKFALADPSISTSALLPEPMASKHKELKVNIPTSPPSPTSMIPVSACTTRDSLAARWSWTNSQAPPTPRLGLEGSSYAPSNRSSLSSLARLKTISDWVKSQASRNQQSAPPLPFAIRRTANLKNQAYKPTLIPTPARALTKPRIVRVGSINAISRPSESSQDQLKPLPAPPVTIPPEVEEQQAKWNQSYIDLVQQDRRQKYRLI